MTTHKIETINYFKIRCSYGELEITLDDKRCKFSKNIRGCDEIVSVEFSIEQLLKIVSDAVTGAF